MTSSLARAAVLCGLLAVACTKDAGDQYVRFNDVDGVDVQITPGDPGDPVSVDLLSTTGAVTVGTGTVDPGSAPAGSLHAVTVDVVDDYQEDVVRVLIDADSGSRGTETFTLERDSADHGHWYVEIQSVGRTDETRTDHISFRLFTLADDGVDTGG